VALESGRIEKSGREWDKRLPCCPVDAGVGLERGTAEAGGQCVHPCVPCPCPPVEQAPDPWAAGCAQLPQVYRQASGQSPTARPGRSRQQPLNNQIRPRTGAITSLQLADRGLERDCVGRRLHRSKHRGPRRGIPFSFDRW